VTAAPANPPTTNLDAALAYARRGWRVIPIPPGKKHPGISAWQREGTTDEAKIRHWWSQAPTHGIGIVCGPESGLWVLDIDNADGKAGDESLIELLDAYGPLPETFEVITGSGGRHLYFAWPDGYDIRNDQSGRLGADLDIRGEGGQVLAPPTIHPNGRPYEREASSPDALAAAPGWLLALLTNHPTAAPRQPAEGAGDRPGDLWALATPWDDLLGGDGWSKLRPGPGGEDRWCRPGKDAREGPSATVGYRGSDVLKVFSSSVTHLGLLPEHTYTKLGYLAATRFGSDHSAAAAWCRQQGYGTDVRSLVAPGGDGNAPLPVLPPAPEPWPDPTPWPTLDALPAFPLEVLPSWVAEHAVAAAEARQVPVDLCATLAIGSLAAAATGRAVIVVHEDWREPMALYLVCAMRSGAGKSPAEKSMVDWLRRWERERIAKVVDGNQRSEIALDLAKKKAATLGRNDSASVDDLLAAHEAVKVAEGELTPVPRLIIDDATPERVVTMLAAYGERLAVLSSEADLFDGLLRGTPSQRPNVNIYLKAWSGDEYRRDRQGGSEVGPEGAILANPLLTVSVTVQPSVLARLLTDAEMVGRGFAARFMVSAPADLMGQRDQRRRFRSRSTATAATYEAEAVALAERWSRWANPAHLHLADDAAERFEDFLVELEPALAVGAELEDLAEWAAKLTASVARYAGLLHLCEDDPQAPISGEAMDRAITLGRYWLAHAKGVARSGEDRTTRQARTLLEWIASTGASEVSLRDLQNGCRRPGEGLDRVADYEAPVDLLIAHGWLRPVDNDDWRNPTGMKRSRSPRFQIAPSARGSSPDAVLARVARSASMGERDSLSSPTPPPPTPTSRATRYTRYSEGAVDNSEPIPAPPKGLDEILGVAEDDPITTSIEERR
jgi:hypothetical protein